jgi:hypothetical protein
VLKKPVAETVKRHPLDRQDIYDQPIQQQITRTSSSLLMIKMPTVPMPRFPTGHGLRSRAAHHVDFRIKNRPELRRAMRSHLIFSKPASLEPGHAGT